MGGCTYSSDAVLLQQIFNSHAYIYFVVCLGLTGDILHESLEIPAAFTFTALLHAFL